MILDKVLDAWRRAPPKTKAAVVVGSVAAFILYKKKTRAAAARPKPQALDASNYNTETPKVAFTSDGGVALQRGLSAAGVASRAPETVGALVDRLEDNASEALAWEDGGNWRSFTWAEYVAQVRAAARAMIALGLAPTQGVGIVGFNSKEWLIADLGAVLAGGFASGIYSTNGPDAVQYVLEHSRAALVVVEGKGQLDKVRSVAGALPGLKAAVVWGDAGSDLSALGPSAPVLAWDAFLASAPADGGPLAARVAAQESGHCCTLIYTSGTTGRPKAVMISHDNVTWVVASFAEFVRFGKAPGGRERLVSYLPLSHIAAQAIDIYAGLVTVGRSVGCGPVVNAATLFFARPDALKGTLKATLQHVRPTVFFGVPRVWEKFAEALQAVGASTTGVKKKLSTWAKKVALAKYREGRADAAAGAYAGLLGGALTAAERALAMVILKKVHAAIGLDRAHFLFTGAAPIASSTLEYFGSLGLVVNEAFGMSEVAGPAAVTLNEYYAPGYCGPAVPGVEIKLDHVAGRDKPGEGEVCFRGRSVMLGYLRDDGKTREAVDADGWNHSGDTGALVPFGAGAAPMLKITGRIKELLITAGGENVPPVPIEDALKSLLPGVSTAVVVGDKLKFLSVLFTLKQQQNDATGSFDDVLVGAAKDVNPAVTSAKDAENDAVWRKACQTAIDAYNDTAVSSAQKVQKFAILPLDFSQNTGELTPTLKLKRAAVVEKYGFQLKKIYGDAASAVWM